LKLSQFCNIFPGWQPTLTVPSHQPCSHGPSPSLKSPFTSNPWPGSPTQMLIRSPTKSVDRFLWKPY